MRSRLHIRMHAHVRRVHARDVAVDTSNAPVTTATTTMITTTEDAGD